MLEYLIVLLFFFDKNVVASLLWDVIVFVKLYIFTLRPVLMNQKRFRFMFWLVFWHLERAQEFARGFIRGRRIIRGNFILLPNNIELSVIFYRVRPRLNYCK